MVYTLIVIVMNFTRVLTISAAMLTGGLLLGSCINEQYGGDKDFDGTVVILKDIAMPLGNLGKISVSDIIPVDAQEDQMISIDANGNYAFNFKGGDPYRVYMSVPSLTIPFEESSAADEHVISITIPSDLAGKPAPSENRKFAISDQRVEKVINVKDDYRLPYQVKDIKSLETAVKVTYNFTTEYGVIHIADGFKMDFPDWLVIAKDEVSDKYTIENYDNNKNVVVFADDTRISPTAPLALNLIISSITLPEGSVKELGTDAQGRPLRKIEIDENLPANKVVATGGIFIETRDYTTVPAKAELKMHLALSDFQVNSANILMDITASADDKTIPEVDYPEFFGMDGVVIDLHNPHLVFTIKNTLDTELNFTADIEAFRDADKLMSTHIGSSDLSDKDAFIINPLCTKEVVYSRLGNGADQKAMPELGELLKVLPNIVKVSNIQIASTDKYSNISPGKVYECSLEYKLYAPLAFGSEFSLPYHMEINDLGSTFQELKLLSASLLMTVENTLPLNFSVKTEALDQEGRPVEKLSVSVNGDVDSGTLNSPTVNTIEINLNSSADPVQLQSLKLNLNATCPSAKHQGIALNQAQGLKISSLALRLPDGITVNLSGLTEDPTREE